MSAPGGASRPRAVIFDWGGVIQRTVDPAPRGALAAQLGMCEADLERGVFGVPVWQEASIGRVSADDAWAAIVGALGWPAERLDEFVERFFAGDRLDAEIVVLIHRLRKADVRVGLLSNAPPGRSRSDSPAGRWGMDGLFDAQVFSYEVGALKPDPAMYRAILAALDVRPEEALFFDDAPENVEGARAVGLRAHHFCGLDALRRALAAHGLGLDAQY